MTPTVSVTGTAETPPQAVPTVTLEPDPRPAPDDWRDWDVLPWISQRAVEIYRRGLDLGNDPHAFSVVGDCQAIQEVFLGLYEEPALYRLDAATRYLQATIDHFDGSFGRASYAVRGGYSAASILSPLQADPIGCHPGETPLACELRHHKPSLLVISLEVWFDPETVDRYEDYLRAILDLSIERGILPILVNKADMNEAKRHVINPVLAKLAAEYQLPLVNFWRAAQSLPNFGIDPEREGFHLSQEGYWMKSLVALQALDMIRQASGERTRLDDVSPTPDPLARDVPEPVDDAEFDPVCNGEGAGHPGCAIFDMVTSRGGQLEPAGIWSLDLMSGDASIWLPPGYRLLHVSPDGAAALIGMNRLLYLVELDGGDAALISEALSPGTSAAAFLGSSGGIAWIEDGSSSASIHVMQSDGARKDVHPSAGNPVSLIPAHHAERVVALLNQDCGESTCESLGYWYFDLTSGEELLLAGVLEPALSPDLVHIAFKDEIYQPTSRNAFNDRLLIEQLKRPLVSRRLFRFQPANGYMSTNRLEGYVWSQDGSWLLVWMDEYSKYYERSSGSRTYLMKINTGMTWEYSRVMGSMPRAAWSPSGGSVLVGWMNFNDADGSNIHFRLIDTRGRIETDLTESSVLNLPGYQYLGHLFWIIASGE